MNSPRLLRLKAVAAKVGMTRSSIYAQIKAKQFPKPVALGSQSVAWLESEIDEWISKKIAARDALAKTA